MPIYGFECESCGHRFDRLQKLSDADPTHCPVCEKETLRRQLTAPQFRLSGSGWEGSTTQSTAGAESKTEAKPESKPESKPEVKADVKPASPSSGAGTP